MRVLACDGVAKEAVDMLKNAGHDVVEADPSPEELENMICDFHGVIVRSKSKVTRSVIDKGTNLKGIARAGIGVDNIDVAYAKEKGIPVVNAPTGSTNSVAELSLGLILALARNIVWADSTTKQGRWEKKKLKGLEVDGKVLGLVGVGNIAQCLAEKAQALGMTTIGYDPYLPQEVAAAAGVELKDLDNVLKEADYVSLHVVLTDETRGMIGAEKIALMKPSGCIVNCARGGVVDEKALYNALKEKRIRAAALDVFEKEPLADSPLAELDNIILTPHIGASTKEGQIRAGTIVVEQLLMAMNDKKPDYLVNTQLSGKWG